jgi:hypothetical protein
VYFNNLHIEQHLEGNDIFIRRKEDVLTLLFGYLINKQKDVGETLKEKDKSETN